MPVRLQRKRTKGYRLPPDAVYVGRPTKWGNPFEAYKCPCCGYWDVRDDNGMTYLVRHDYVRQPHVRADRSTWTTQREAIVKSVQLYGDEATYWLGGWETTRPDLHAALTELRGRDLACWCPLSAPCHGDVLLELANREATDA